MVYSKTKQNLDDMVSSKSPLEFLIAVTCSFSKVYPTVESEAIGKLKVTFETAE
jgi:hypothetical protein